MHSNKNWEAERQRHKRVEQELGEENLRLQKRVADLEVAADARASQSKSEAKKVMEEKDRLAFELEEWHGKCDRLNRELEDYREEKRRLRKEITDLTFTNDELQEKVAYYQRKYKNAISDYEEELVRKQNGEGALRSDQTLRKLMEIEEKLSNINVAAREVSEEDSKQEDVDTEKLLEEGSENFEKNLTSYQLQKGKGKNLLKKLTRKILRKEELKNAHIQNLFKLDEIDLKDRENEYKNLLKAMGALYYANRSAKVISDFFNLWKAATAAALEQIEEQPCEESQKSKPAKPAIEINTELANKNTHGNDALLSELQINTNKEPSGVEDRAIILRGRERPEQAIRIHDEYKESPEAKDGSCGNSSESCEIPAEKESEVRDRAQAKAGGARGEVRMGQCELKNGQEEYYEPRNDEEMEPVRDLELKEDIPEVKKKALEKAKPKKSGTMEANKNELRLSPESKTQSLGEDSKGLSEPGLNTHPRPDLEPITESKSKARKVHLKDIDDDELNKLIAQLRDHLIEELQSQKQSESESPAEKVVRVEFKGSATEIYHKLVKGLADYFFNIFCQAVKYAKAKNMYDFLQNYRKTLAVLIDALRKLRTIAGHPIFMLIALAMEMKTIDKIADCEIPGNECRVIVIELVRKQLMVLPGMSKSELVAAELYNWCGEILGRIGNPDLQTEEDIYKYVYQLLAVMYRCSKDDRPSLLHRDYRRLIEGTLAKALQGYFREYRRHEESVVGEEDSAASLGINRHMFCKYPFLKKLLN